MTNHVRVMVIDHDHDGAGDFFFSLYYYLVSWSRSL